jgi:hypothetical protein
MTDPQDVVRFKVWYVGGASTEGESFADWQALPDDGVLSVMLWHEDGTRRVMQGNDFYFATPGGVYGHNDHPQQETERRYPGASVKRGMWTTDEIMEKVSQEAMESS